MKAKPQSKSANKPRGMCAECGDNRALFRIKCGQRVRADKKHNLCFRCSRAYINRNREEESVLWQ
jgi:hypothetical protein